jgi:hypothetical protein
MVPFTPIPVPEKQRVSKAVHLGNALSITPPPPPRRLPFKFSNMSSSSLTLDINSSAYVKDLLLLKLLAYFRGLYFGE